MMNSMFVDRLSAVGETRPELVDMALHAVAIARECEFIAKQSSSQHATSVSAVYPPMVELLAALYVDDDE